MTRIFVLLWALSLSGCGVVVDPVGSAATTSTSSSPASDGISETGGGETTHSPTTSGDGSTSSSTTETSSSSGEDPHEFIVTPDGGGSTIECDVFAQDCAAGMKCAAYAEGGGSSWNATKCVPVNGDQQPGEPCTAEGGGVSGLDDCIKGAMCWDVDAMNQGICVELCTGSEEMPVCTAPNTDCKITAEGVINICLPICEPLVQDCSGDDLCLPVDGTYVCVLDASGDLGAAFDACEFANACDPGLLCLSPLVASECDANASGCCSPMCSLADNGATCPGVGQQCFPMYEPQPPGFEDVGYCSLMP